MHLHLSGLPIELEQRMCPSQRSQIDELALTGFLKLLQNPWEWKSFFLAAFCVQDRLDL
jgi:hypothetical protein